MPRPLSARTSTAAPAPAQTGGDVLADAIALYASYSGEPADWSAHAAPFLARYPASQDRTNAMRAGRKARLLSPKYDPNHPDHPNA